MAESLRGLIEAARRGDAEARGALAQCVDRFVRIFHGSLSTHVRIAQGSTIDFVLEGIAEALTHLDELTYRSDEEFYGWMAQFIRHRILDAVRREGRLKRGAPRSSLAEEESRAISPGDSPSAVVQSQDLKETVGRAVLELQLEHPDEMEAVVLKVFEGETWAGIKDHLGLSSEKRARTLYARGIDLLRPGLERQGLEGAVGGG